jgi:transposase
MFPELGERVIETGNDIKYCPSIKVHIHRDIMAAENMADMLVYEINGLSRPEYLSRQVVNLQKSN